MAKDKKQKKGKDSKKKEKSGKEKEPELSREDALGGSGLDDDLEYYARLAEQDSDEDEDLVVPVADTRQPSKEEKTKPDKKDKGKKSENDWQLVSSAQVVEDDKRVTRDDFDSLFKPERDIFGERPGTVKVKPLDPETDMMEHINGVGDGIKAIDALIVSDYEPKPESPTSDSPKLSKKELKKEKEKKAREERERKEREKKEEKERKERERREEKERIEKAKQAEKEEKERLEREKREEKERLEREKREEKERIEREKKEEKERKEREKLEEKERKLKEKQEKKNKKKGEKKSDAEQESDSNGFVKVEHPSTPTSDLGDSASEPEKKKKRGILRFALGSSSDKKGKADKRKLRRAQSVVIKTAPTDLFTESISEPSIGKQEEIPDRRKMMRRARSMTSLGVTRKKPDTAVGASSAEAPELGEDRSVFGFVRRPRAFSKKREEEERIEKEKKMEEQRERIRQRQEEERKNEAATTIQALIRGEATRKTVKPKLEKYHEEFVRRNTAIRRIETMMIKFKARQKLYTAFEMAREKRIFLGKKAAIIQAHIKGYLTRTDAQRRSKRAIKERKYTAAVKIQSLYRGNAARSIAGNIHDGEMRMKVARDCSRLWRGYRDRKIANQMRARRRRMRAVVLLQTKMRVRLAMARRKLLSRKLKEDNEVKSAVKIQSVYRMSAAKDVYRREHKRSRLQILIEENRAMGGSGLVVLCDYDESTAAYWRCNDCLLNLCPLCNVVLHQNGERMQHHRFRIGQAAIDQEEKEKKEEEARRKEEEDKMRKEKEKKKKTDGAMSEIEDGQMADFKGMKLTQIPVDISVNLGLKELDLSNNEIHVVSPDIAALSNLRILRLSNNRLKKLPAEIGTLKLLSKLEVESNQLSSEKAIPPSIEGAGRLREINFKYNELTELPPNLGQCVLLSKLDLSYNKIAKLPTALRGLRNLRELDLSFNDMKEIPATVFRFRSLRKLALTGNMIETIPKAIEKLQSLMILSLDGNSLVLDDLPAVMQSLRVLSFLDVSRNVIRPNEAGHTVLPLLLCQLPAMLDLRVSECGLDIIPPQVGLMTGLKNLDISNNRIESLPFEFSYLRGLQSLNVDNNPASSSIPDYVKEMGPGALIACAMNPGTLPERDTRQSFVSRIFGGDDAHVPPPPNEIVKPEEVHVKKDQPKEEAKPQKPVLKRRTSRREVTVAEPVESPKHKPITPARNLMKEEEEDDPLFGSW